MLRLDFSDLYDHLLSKKVSRIFEFPQNSAEIVVVFLMIWIICNIYNCSICDFMTAWLPYKAL